MELICILIHFSYCNSFTVISYNFHEQFCDFSQRQSLSLSLNVELGIRFSSRVVFVRGQAPFLPCTEGHTVSSLCLSLVTDMQVDTEPLTVTNTHAWAHTEWLMFSLSSSHISSQRAGVAFHEFSCMAPSANTIFLFLSFYWHLPNSLYPEKLIEVTATYYTYSHDTHSCWIIFV